MAMNKESSTMFESNSRSDACADIIQPEMVPVLAAKSEAERLRIGWGMWRSARNMLARIVAMEFPEMSAEEQRHLVARRMSHGT